MQTVYTVGHSTRSAEEFLRILAEYGVRRLVDVRRFPGSRRYPHFGADPLAESLAQQGIRYRHEPDLGGRRRGEADSPNTYWRSATFRAYADYMASREFQAALARLVSDAHDSTVAIMCAEAVPWRCHRQLIADALSLRGIEVVDIMDEQHSSPHRLNPSAQLLPDGRVIYPAIDARQKDLFAK